MARGWRVGAHEQPFKTSATVTGAEHVWGRRRGRGGDQEPRSQQGIYYINKEVLEKIKKNHHVRRQNLEILMLI